ncbi:MAG TPA: hypothetical protein VNF50_14225 [Acidimicrobiales bacterium]|nr:hypothetical protein [Acidimicrobiales bacterium]
MSSTALPPAAGPDRSPVGVLVVAICLSLLAALMAVLSLGGSRGAGGSTAAHRVTTALAIGGGSGRRAAPAGEMSGPRNRRRIATGSAGHEAQTKWGLSGTKSAAHSSPRAGSRSTARAGRGRRNSAARPAVIAHSRPLWGPGYRLAAADGGVFSFGNARFLGSMGDYGLAAPVVALATTPDGLGYWEAAGDGGVFAFGDARYMGGMGGHPISAPVVAMAAVPEGSGYWLAAADGGIFTYGAAPFLGSLAGRHLRAPVVGMAATPDGRGYWLVAGDGGVFAFGDARYFGGMAGYGIAAPIVGMAATPDGTGYWLVAADGGVFTYGTAHYYGGMGGHPLAEPMVGIAAEPDGKGYWLAAADGGIFTYGAAGFWGAPGGYGLNRPVTAVAAGLSPAYRAAAQVELGGRYGFDVSWPQCDDRGLPSGHAFAVLGVTDGKAFTRNPCLASQWAWATAAAGTGGLYINLNEPGSGSRANFGPAGHCHHGDLACTAYNYGANTVDQALSYARAQRATAPMVWLDVETGNAWTPYGDVNALVIKGAIDQLHRGGLAAGIYSTSLQWDEITGGADFGLPVWVAGSPDLNSAPSYCSDGFNGGQVWMVQTMLNYDVNYLCRQSYAATAFGSRPLPVAPAFPLDRPRPQGIGARAGGRRMRALAPA